MKLPARLAALALALAVSLTPAPEARAQTPPPAAAARTVVGGRIVLGGSFKEIAANAPSLSLRRAAVTRAALDQAELASELPFEVHLKMRGLSKLLARRAAGETIARDELDARYLPLQADFDAAEAWLASQGFTITRRDGNRLALFAKGTVAQVQAAFQTRFAQVASEGKTFLSAVSAPSVPASLAAVLGVTGLQPFLHSRTYHSAPAPAISNQPPYLVPEVLGAYNVTGTALTGAGQRIGIIIDVPPLASDLSAFWSDNNVAQRLSNITTENTPFYGGGIDSRGGEETLDVSWSSAIAPQATVEVFCTQNLYFVNTDAAYSQIGTELKNGTQPNLHQLSLSYGADEDGTPPDTITADEGYFATIASYGVTIFVASGDNGAFDSSGNLSVSYPASDPSVTAVGGTSLSLDSSTGAVTSETAWSADGVGFSDGRIAASGGGVSGVVPRPAWQTGAGVPAGSTRCVPDIASSADQDKGGYLVFTDPSNGSQGGYSIGGTSWAAPTWAGICALLNQARANAALPPLGLLGPKIYPLIGSGSFRDITVGSNGDYYAGGGYAAGPGYDLVTGIGSPNFPTLVATLIGSGSGVPTITGFNPPSGPVGASVVVTGTNFLAPLTVVFAGNATAAAPTAVSATQFTVIVPAGARTGPVTVTDPNGTAVSAANFIVSGQPVITSAGSAAGQVGQAFSYRIAATGNPTGYGVSPGLPAGLGFNPATGVIAGTPTAAGTAAVTISATNANGTGSAPLTLTINPPSPVVTSAPMAGGHIGVAFSYQITASNAPTSFGAAGLPPGLGVNPATGLISGTPTAAGTFAASVSATNAGGGGTAPLTVTIIPDAPVITSATAGGGQVGVPFGYQLTASNNPTSYTATGLPAGLTFNAAAAVISGTPTAAGTFPIALGAANAGGTGSAALTLTINPATPVVGGAATAAAQVGSTFAYRIAASNNPTSYAATGLPAGLSVNPATGAISGTPAVAGTFAVGLSATNAGGTGTGALTLTINPATPIIAGANTVTGQAGTAFTFQIVASNSPASYAAAGLPGGLSVNPATGVIAGTPAAAGTFTVGLSATNAGGTGTGALTLTINPASPVIASAPTITGQVGSVFFYQIAASNNPTSFSATGLPAGLGLNTATGLVSGTPAQAGNFAVNLQATNAGGTGAAAVQFAIAVAAPVLTSAPNALGQVGSPFTYQITATNAPASFGASGLPPGLALNPATGFITGSPAAAGAYVFNVSATNSGGTGTGGVTLAINPAAPVITSATAAGARVGGPFTYQVAASNGPASFGASGLPPGLTIDPGTGLIFGAPTAAGSYPVNLSAANAGGIGTGVVTIQVDLPAPVITSAASAAGMVASAFSYQIAATNNPASFGADGLPAGLSVDPGTGLIAGTPAAAGTFAVTLRAASGTGTGTASLTLTIAAGTPVVSFVLPGTNGGNSTTIVEGGPKLKILVQRAGGDLTQALTVHYKPKGNNVPGVDYKAVSGTVVIPAGAASALVKVKIFDDGVVDGTKLLKLRLVPAADGSYEIGAPLQVKVRVLDLQGGP